ncbi:flagellin [Candidatus Nitrosotalea bavarica]|uniref:flagellin n=1 Tax=Candidatus Nitrosotalea bavarica TaxID=1903277 RepID=UPI000C714BAB|nr:flagellin [Candidatus Nitrosotalea bavarica]
MKSTTRSRKTRRGVIGLNMGFSTTQKAKTAISSSVSESSSALEIAGKVTGFGDVSAGTLNATVIPIKVAGGGDSVSLDPALTDVKYYSNTVRYDNIYGVNCVLGSTSYNNASAAIDAAVNQGCTNSNSLTSAAPHSTQAIIYWDVNINNNNILDVGEHANMVIQYDSADKPKQLDDIKAEIIVPTGSALTVERQVPAITTQIVDLG